MKTRTDDNILAIRGQGFDAAFQGPRSARRGYQAKSEPYGALGFRCAISTAFKER